MIWFVIIIALALILSSSKSGTGVTTIDNVQPSPVIDKIIQGTSEPALRKPTPTTDPVVTSTPVYDVGSKFLTGLSQSDTM